MKVYDKKYDKIVPLTKEIENAMKRPELKGRFEKVNRDSVELTEKPEDKEIPINEGVTTKPKSSKTKKNDK